LLHIKPPVMLASLLALSFLEKPTGGYLNAKQIRNARCTATSAKERASQLQLGLYIPTRQILYFLKAWQEK